MASLSLIATSSAVVGTDPAILDAIGHPDCALAQWRRSLDPALADAIAAIDDELPDDVDATVPVADAAIHVAALLGAAGYPQAAAVALARDIALAIGLHAASRGAPFARVRLDWIETDACRRFHADVLTTRLLVTYAGRGTQWRLADEPDEAARETACGDVLLLKGRLLAPDASVLHRSPPIAADGGRRLLLVIDPPRTPDD